ncbi:MAG: hypothetical protein GXO64_04900 [Candidatus Micrarchaeota archaeon]|nr:hypothetical protein [Candidatus Micrarchaeota archaeon]
MPIISTLLKKMIIARAFRTEKGRIRMFGKMDWTLYSSKALAHFFQVIGDKFGEDFLYDLSYRNGRGNAMEMIKAMNIKPKGGWATQTAIISLLDFLGYGKIKFVKTDIDKEGHHHFIIHSIENPIVEHAVRMYGKNSHACAYWMGLLAGHGELELGLKNARLKENKCIKDGSQYCEYESIWKADG